MSERKATNKYYPPDYDPIKAEQEARKLSKRLKTMNKDVMTIRLMTPFSMRCLKCNEFIPKKRKFNAKKETMPERYLDKIRIYRFEIRCPSCNNAISFRTNPKTGDYTMDFGGVKNFSSDRRDQVDEDLGKETIEQTLERLEREQAEADGAGDEQKDKDRMELIEEKLLKLQQEQEDDAELERIARREQKKTDILKAHDAARKRSREEQENLDNLIAEQAFQAADLADGQEQGKPDQPNVVPVKLCMKRKKNPLGIKLKKK